MASAALTILSMTIGFYFILMGTMKITPAVNEEVHKQLRKTYIRAVKVFPFISTLKQHGYKFSAHTYRKAVACLEIVCGVLLAIVPGPMKQAANVVLMFSVALSLYTHLMQGDKFDQMTPAVVFCLLLACRMIVYYQVKSREESEQRQAMAASTEGEQKKIEGESEEEKKER